MPDERHRQRQTVHWLRYSTIDVLTLGSKGECEPAHSRLARVETMIFWASMIASLRVVPLSTANALTNCVVVLSFSFGTLIPAECITLFYFYDDSYTNAVWANSKVRLSTRRPSTNFLDNADSLTQED